jgi:hypothetical protein
MGCFLLVLKQCDYVGVVVVVVGAVRVGGVIIPSESKPRAVELSEFEQ